MNKYGRGFDPRDHNNRGQIFGALFGQDSNGKGLRHIIAKIIKLNFLYGSATTRLVYINICVFLVIKIISLILGLFGVDSRLYYAIILENLGVPADVKYLISHPWTLITYMFTHFQFFHLLFNMVWLSVFGKIFLSNFTKSQMYTTYIIGGLIGSITYIIGYHNLFDVVQQTSSWAIGASASVMAIVFVSCIYQPKMEVRLFLLGRIKLIYLAMIVLLIDLIGLNGANAGGSLAHLGGAIYGIIFAFVVKQNFGSIFTHSQRYKPKMKIKYQTNSQNTDNTSETYEKKDDLTINIILDKVAKHGYDSLSREEKTYLFKNQ